MVCSRATIKPSSPCAASNPASTLLFSFFVYVRLVTIELVLSAVYFYSTQKVGGCAGEDLLSPPHRIATGGDNSSKLSKRREHWGRQAPSASLGLSYGRAKWKLQEKPLTNLYLPERYISGKLRLYPSVRNVPKFICTGVTFCDTSSGEIRFPLTLLISDLQGVGLWSDFEILAVKFNTIYGQLQFYLGNPFLKSKQRFLKSFCVKMFVFVHRKRVEKSLFWMIFDQK